MQNAAFACATLRRAARLTDENPRTRDVSVLSSQLGLSSAEQRLG